MDETTGRYTASDYNRDKDAISELTKSDTIGYDDALNMIEMGLFLDDGDELMPGGASVEDMAETMTSEGWWSDNKAAMRKRSNQYFQGILLNPNFTDQEAYQKYKTDTMVERQQEIENLKVDPAYTTAKSTVNTIMDSEGAWMTKAGIRATDADGKIQYYNPNTGKEMDLDDFAEDFSATYQLATSSQPLEWVMGHYKNGGMNNAVIKQLNKESPSLVQNYLLPLKDEMDSISMTENAVQAQTMGLRTFSAPTALPPELDTALRAFQTEEVASGTVVADPTADPNATVLAGGQTFKGTGQSRIEDLRALGVKTEYIEMMGNSLNTMTDQEILYGNMENDFITMYDPNRSETAYEDIYNIEDPDFKDYMVGRLNDEQFSEYDEYFNRAQAGVDNLTAATSSISADLIAQRSADYAREREEFVNLNDELKDFYGQRSILNNELNELQSSLDQMISIEKDEYLADHGYLATYGDQALSATGEFLSGGSYIPPQYEMNVTSGTSDIHGKAGQVLFEQIREKEAALAAIDSELHRAVKTRGGTTYWPGERITEVSDARAEAREAKESLERLIQESLDELPALYRTEGGK